MASRLLVALLALLMLAGVNANHLDPNCNGKQVIVHLFEWKWSDIAQECERYLAGSQYCGVQVSPPNEHIVLSDRNYPWWQRYQPVSFLLTSRSGTEDEFVDMVHRCNKVGVRIYVDAVINHMAGFGQSGVGSAGSSYDAGQLSFPAVPYGPNDFTPCSLCPSADCNLDNYLDPTNVRNCRLYSLVDVFTRDENVRDRITAYFNTLARIGVAGLRIDAAKNMWPEDISAILERVQNLPVDQGFQQGSKFFIYQDVALDFYEEDAIQLDEYFNTGYVTENRYSKKIYWGVQDYSELANVFDPEIGMAPSKHAFIFVDNHDSQRGHGFYGNITTYKTPREYKQAVAYTLASDYGFTRIMSSYDFEDSDQGPPTNGGGSTADVVINADGSCGGGWICEHRWNVMKKMVMFRNHVSGTNVRSYWNDGKTVAFSRDGRGFFAMAQNGHMDEYLQTDLPAGTYCNLIDDCATSIRVANDGMAQITINNAEEPILAVIAP